ncbi:MAG: elongation factor Ts [Oscillospiraceae bacterium]|nr:elongation factor Ts [Oscillospiraceae bacterium]
MSFAAKDVKVLRERTGCGMMDCKRALVDSDGDMDKAIEILREKGLAAAAKKAGRIATEGLVISKLNKTNDIGVILEINSETDFVSKNNEFIEFVELVADTIIEKKPSNIDDLMKETLVGKSNTVEDILREKILTIGENIKIRRFNILEGSLSSYIHGGGRIGVLVKFETDISSNQDGLKEYGKDIAMQIAASYPQFIDKSIVPADVLQKEKDILLAQALNEGKPKNIAEKMVEGRISKYYKEICLLDQPFIKDMDISIEKYTTNVSQKLSGNIKIKEFIRFEKGEGLEKKEDNFADEVASMI